MDVLHWYSQQPALLDDLERVTKRLARALADPSQVRRSVCSMPLNATPPESLTARLGEAGVRQLIASYQAGTLAAELAEQYGVSLSTVRRLLRKHGGRLKDG